MDPYLEHPALWPDVHNRLIAAIADFIAPLVAPRYYVGIKRRTYVFGPDDLAFIGRPDVAVFTHQVAEPQPVYGMAAQRGGPMWVELPMLDEVGETFIEIRAVETGKVITVMEILSPANKVSERGRGDYLAKRTTILETRTNLIEIDLLRAGEPMPARIKQAGVVRGDYNVLISRGWQRPRAQLYAFGVRDSIPTFPVPLLRGEDEPSLALNDILHGLYARARFDLQLRYDRSPMPPLRDEDVAWVQALISTASTS